MNLSALIAAIAIVESADRLHPQGNDLARGRKGEVSRYQIMPSTWRRFGGGALINAKDPKKARVVALKIVGSFWNGYYPSGTVEANQVRTTAMCWNPTWMRGKSLWQKWSYIYNHPNCYPNRVLREYWNILAKEKRK